MQHKILYLEIFMVDLIPIENYQSLSYEDASGSEIMPP